MDDNEIDKIRRRLDAVSALGPLLVEPDDSLKPSGSVYRLISPKKKEDWRLKTSARTPCLATVYSKNDAVFFASAALAITRLLAEVDGARGLDEMRKMGLDALRTRAETAEAERDAYKKAKAENDERFMIERDEARERAEGAEAAEEKWATEAAMWEMEFIHQTNTAADLRAMVNKLSEPCPCPHPKGLECRRCYEVRALEAAKEETSDDE